MKQYFCRLLNKKGQVAIEYLLMIAMTALVVMTVGQNLKGHLTAPCSENPKSLACMIEKAFGSGNFQYYPLMR